VVYEGPHRADGRPQGALRAQKTDARTLADVIEGADIFLGLSAAACAEARDGRAMAPGR
jgi:malate dehydrogenase (oxaloacetate-decarboxylating)(NADP+)